jgi:hypothetical protein
MPAIRKITLDDAVAEKLPPTVIDAIQDMLIEGADLVEQSTCGGLVCIVNGELVAKLHLRFPVKKTLLFLGSVTTLVWLFITTIYLYLAHIRVTWQ